MFNAVIINEIRDSSTGETFKIGDRVRVLKKPRETGRPGSEFIGTIQSINEKSFVLIVEGDENIMELEKIDKMRFAKAGENFYNTFNFETDEKLVKVVATRKSNKNESKNIFVNISEAQAEKYCEQWGWSYDENGHSYWLSIEPMAD